MDAEGLAVAKKKKPAPKANAPKTTPVKLETGLARKAKTIAEDKGVDLSDYLATIVREQIDKDWVKILKRIAEAET